MMPDPGDIAVCSMGGHGGRIIRLLQWVNGDGFRDYEHALIYLGDGQVLQAEPGGATVGPLGGYGHIMWSTGLFPPLDAEHLALLPGIAAAMEGTPYSWLDYAALAAHRLRLPVPGLRGYIKSTGHQMCSALADHVSKLLGRHWFTDGRFEGYVTPGALARRMTDLGAEG